MRAARIMLAVVALAAVAWLLPASVGGSASYVTTHGISMEPGFQTGDLAIVRRADEYRVGDVVAYHSEQMNTVVMHRIIAVDGDRYSFRGDNNNFIDVDHPTAADFLGRLAVRIPEGGIWLQRLGSPLGLAVVAFALLAGGSTAATTRHRRKRRRGSMSRHTSTRPTQHQTLGSLPSALRVSAALAGVFAMTGAALGAVAWSGPLEEPTISHVKTGTRMDFSYAADVGQSPAYDGTVANSPDPVFRKLTNSVDVHFTYHGDPGTVSVRADLSAPGGWHSTIPLTGTEAVAGPGYEGKVTLDPMPAPQGRPLIDVTTFPTLAKLAERYGLLVLHWTRSDVETFIVQDENITYRYRAGSDPSPAERPSELADIQP